MKKIFIEEEIHKALKELKKNNLIRKLDLVPTGLVDLSHNDYLGISQDDEFQKKCLDAASKYPFSSKGSRLLGGNHYIFQEVEQKFSKFKNCQQSLLFNSGYHANEAIACCLNLPGVGFYSDQLNHASIIDGIKLSGISKLNKHIFDHNDLAQLEALLKKSTYLQNVIFVESLYSMDGDFCDLERLIYLIDRYDGLLVLDEAHALGAYGDYGEGLFNEKRNNVITINPCGKALGSNGAFISGSNILIDFLINKARSFIYTTALSPWLASNLGEVISYIPFLEDRRNHLKTISKLFKTRLKANKIDSLDSSSHIFPIICKSPQSALNLSDFLVRNGYFTKAIRPPTVPDDLSRVRISLNSNLKKKDMENLVKYIAEFQMK